MTAPGGFGKLFAFGLRHAHGSRIAVLLGLSVWLAFTGLSSAQPSAVGGEFLVNTYTTGNQKIPGAAMNAAGDFVIVWDSFGQDGDDRGIFGQLFDSTGAPRGAEFQANSYTTGAQYPAEAAMDPNGNFVVVWNSTGRDGNGRGVFARRFDSSGAPRGGDFQVNTYTTSSQYRHTAEMASDGSFVIAWNSAVGDGSGYGIFARRFDSDGMALDAQEFQVNTYATGSQQFPKMDINGAGELLVSWESDGPDGDADGIFARRFDFFSGPIDAEEFQVNTYTTGAQRVPGAAIQENGDFVVVWKGDGQDGDGYGILARRFDSSGAALDAQEFQVNTFTTNSQREPWVVVDSSGAIIVTWEGFPAVSGRRFEADGTPIDASQFTIPQTGGNFATLAGGHGPHFVSAWMAGAALDGDGNGIGGQLATCDLDGDALCNRLDIVLTDPLDMDLLDCSDPRNIRPTFTWEPGSFDRFKVFMGNSPGFEKGTRVTSGDKAIKTTTWQPSRKKWRKACRKALEGDPFNPFLYIQVQGKDRDVPRKDPFRKTGSQTVLVDIQ